MTEATIEQAVAPPSEQAVHQRAETAVPEIIDHPCRHYAPDLLTWAEHPELEPFMRATYEAHVARSCARRTFEPSVPEAELTEVARDKYLRHDAARLATRLLSEARSALREAQAAGDADALAVESFGISSAYRSALRQYRLWHHRFAGYLADTAQQRAELPGGPLGYQAAQWLAGWIGTWLAAPGFSNHNDGRAIDLYCRLASGRVLSASRADIPHWHATWLHRWLTRNAARFDFHPYEREPWHWEHRPGAATGTLTAPAHPQQRGAAAGSVETEAAETATATGPAAYWIRHLRYGLAGNTVEPLIDGPTAFQAIQHAIESADNASHFIYLLAWWCDPWVNLTGPGTSLLDLFARAGERGVQVRVLMWEPSRLVAGEQARLHDAAVDAINRLPNCHAQQDSGQVTAKSHHQKLLVVQGRGGLVALGGGVDVNADRVHDLPPPAGSYRADRPAVGWSGSSGSGGSGPAGSGNPLHDVHARLTGPTALPLLRMFLRRWWARSGDRAIDRRAPLRGDWLHPVPAPTGSQFVRVGETFNGVLRLPSGDVRSRQVTVQDIWLRSILAARRFIYMEEQYLISECAARAIRSVLHRLDHVTIVIPPSEITDLPGAWARRLTFIENITAGNPDAGKLHIYTRTPGQPPCHRVGVPHSYVHAKMAVIDDELMLIGSANCNNRGWETDSELVIASFEDASGPGAMAGRLRTALWAHHLGVPASAVADPLRSRGLWDTASSRLVCRYDPRAGRDGTKSRLTPDRLADPSDRRPGDPCLTLLGPASSGGGP